MTVKVYELKSEGPHVESVFITTRAVRVIIENDNIVIEYGVGFFKRYDCKFYGCYVVA